MKTLIVLGQPNPLLTLNGCWVKLSPTRRQIFKECVTQKKGDIYQKQLSVGGKEGKHTPDWKRHWEGKREQKKTAKRCKNRKAWSQQTKGKEMQCVSNQEFRHVRTRHILHMSSGDFAKHMITTLQHSWGKVIKVCIWYRKTPVWIKR